MVNLSKQSRVVDERVRRHAQNARAWPAHPRRFRIQVCNSPYDRNHADLHRSTAADRVRDSFMVGTLVRTWQAKRVSMGLAFWYGHQHQCADNDWVEKCT